MTSGRARTGVPLALAVYVSIYWEAKKDKG